MTSHTKYQQLVKSTVKCREIETNSLMLHYRHSISVTISDNHCIDTFMTVHCKLRIKSYCHTDEVQEIFKGVNFAKFPQDQCNCKETQTTVHSTTSTPFEAVFVPCEPLSPSSQSVDKVVLKVVLNFF